MRVAVESQKAAWLGDPLSHLASALLFLAILFGGGGAEGPLYNAVLQGAGALLLGVVAAAHFRGKALPAEAAGPVWLTVAVLAAISVQLIALPPSLWTAFPGRETAAAMDMLDNRLGWRPISLDPEATRGWATALLLPTALMLVTIGSSRRGLLLMLRSILAAALLSAALGAAQLAMGSPESLAPYGDPLLGSATGVFANSNHHAALLLSALVVAGLTVRLADPAVRIRTARGSWRANLTWLLIPMFAIMGVATKSRAGLILLPLALLAALLIATGRGKVRILLLVFIGIAALVAIPLAMGSELSVLGQVQSVVRDNRLISLPDIIYTLNQFWPVGSGLGTFVPVFKANENLDLVSSAYLNHAHNDVLELLIEMGLMGAVLLALLFIAFVVRLWRARRGRSSEEVVTTLAGASIIMLLGLHSLVDYPLRADAVAAVAGIALGLLTRRGGDESDSARSRSRRKKAKRGFGAPIYSQAGSSS